MKFLTALFLCVGLLSAHAASVVTGTLTITNAVDVGGTIEINADTRTLTNAVTAPSTQILLSTNSATLLSRLTDHFSAYPVSGLALTSDGSSSLSWRGSAVTISLSSNTWASVEYETNPVGVAHSPVVYPYTAVPAAAQTNMANGVADLLNSAAHTTGLSATKLLSGTVPLARLSGITTNEIASAFHDWIASLSDTDDQTAAEVPVAPAGNIAATDTQAALEELDTEKQSALGFTPVNKAGDTMTGPLLVTALTNSALTASRVLVSGADKTVVSSAVTSTTLGYLDATSSIQTQLDSKAAWSAIEADAYDAGTWDGNTNAATKNALRDKFEAILAGGGLGTGDIDTSVELRGIVTDESGTGALLFAGGDIGAATATTPAENDSDTSVATTAYVQTEIAPLLATSWTQVTPDGTNAVINLLGATAGIDKNFYYSLSTSNYVTFSNIVAGAQGTIWINAAGTPQGINFSSSYDNFSTNEIAPPFTVTNRAIIAYKVGWGTDATNVMLGIKRK